MAGTPREGRQHPVDLNKRYIRVQTVGMAIFLSWPVAIMLAAMYGLEQITGQITIGMVMAAAIVFAIGTDKRERLRDKQDG